MNRKEWQTALVDAVSLSEDKLEELQTADTTKEFMEAWKAFAKAVASAKAQLGNVKVTGKTSSWDTHCYRMTSAFLDSLETDAAKVEAS